MHAKMVTWTFFKLIWAHPLLERAAVADFFVMATCQGGQIDVLNLVVENNLMNAELSKVAMPTPCRYGHTDIARLLLTDDRLIRQHPRGLRGRTHRDSPHVANTPTDEGTLR